jgi:hypothetical protein
MLGGARADRYVWPKQKIRHASQLLRYIPELDTDEQVAKDPLIWDLENS